jgi:hypothetical protein
MNLADLVTRRAPPHPLSDTGPLYIHIGPTKADAIKVAMESCQLLDKYPMASPQRQR